MVTPTPPATPAVTHDPNLVIIKKHLGILGFGVQITETEGDIEQLAAELAPNVPQVQVDAACEILAAVINGNAVSVKHALQAVTPEMEEDALTLAETAVTAVVAAIATGQPITLAAAIITLGPALETDLVQVLQDALAAATAPAPVNADPAPASPAG